MDIAIKRFVIKPVASFSYQGRNLHTVQYKGGSEGIQSKPLNKVKAVNGKSGKSCTDSFGFNRADYNRNVYDTGLQEHTPNPFYLPKESEKTPEEAINTLMVERSLTESWRTILKGIISSPTITYQTLYELNFSLEPNDLHSNVSTERLVSLPHVVDPAAKRSIVASAKIVLYDESNIFSTGTLKGALAWHIIQKHPYVAKDAQSVNGGLHRWYVAEENDEFKESAKVNKLENEAIAKLVALQSKYPVTEVLEENILYFITSLCDIKGKPVVKGKVKSFYIDEQLNAYIKTKDKSQVEYNVTKFLSVVEKFEKNSNLFYAEYLVQQADNTGLVQRNNGMVYWLSQKTKNSEWYTFTSMEKFVQFIYQEMMKEDSPAYTTLIGELITSQVVIPKTLQ